MNIYEIASMSLNRNIWIDFGKHAQYHRQLLSLFMYTLVQVYTIQFALYFVVLWCVLIMYFHIFRLFSPALEQSSEFPNANEVTLA